MTALCGTIGVTNKVHGLTFLTPGQWVHGEKLFQMFSLLKGQHPATLTERAFMFQGSEKGLTNKFRPVGGVLQGLGKVAISLE